MMATSRAATGASITPDQAGSDRPQYLQLCQCKPLSMCAKSRSWVSLEVPCWYGKWGLMLKQLFRATVISSSKDIRQMGITAFNILTENEDGRYGSDLLYLSNVKPEELHKQIEAKSKGSNLSTDLLQIFGYLYIVAWKLDDEAWQRVIESELGRLHRQSYYELDFVTDLCMPACLPEWGSSEWRAGRQSLSEQMLRFLLYLIFPVINKASLHLFYLNQLNNTVNKRLVEIFIEDMHSRHIPWLQTYFINFRLVIKDAWCTGIIKYASHYKNKNFISPQVSHDKVWLERLPKKLQCDVCHRNISRTRHLVLFPIEFHMTEYSNCYPRNILRLERGGSGSGDSWNTDTGINYDQGGGYMKRTIGVACQDVCVLENYRTLSVAVNKFMLKLKKMRLYDNLFKGSFSAETPLCTPMNKKEVDELQKMLIELKDEKELMHFASCLLTIACGQRMGDFRCGSFFGLTYENPAADLSKPRIIPGEFIPGEETTFELVNAFIIRMSYGVKDEQMRSPTKDNISLSVFEINCSKKPVHCKDLEFQPFICKSLQLFQPAKPAECASAVDFCFSPHFQFGPSKGGEKKAMVFALPVDRTFFQLYQYIDSFKFLVKFRTDFGESTAKKLLMGKTMLGHHRIYLFVTRFDYENQTADGGFMCRLPNTDLILGGIVLDMFDTLLGQHGSTEFLKSYDEFVKKGEKLSEWRSRAQPTSYLDNDEQRAIVLRNMALQHSQEHLSKKKWPSPVRYFNLVLVLELADLDDNPKYVSMHYAVVLLQPIRPVLERHAAYFGEPVESFRYSYQLNGRYVELDTQDPDLTLTRNMCDDSPKDFCLGTVMISVFPVMDTAIANTVFVNRKDKYVGITKFGLCKLTLRVDDVKNKKKAFTRTYLVGAEDSLELIPSTLYPAFEKTERMNMYAISATCHKSLLQVYPESFRATKFKDLCHALGVPQKELSILLSNDFYYCQRLHPLVPGLLAEGTGEHWNRGKSDNTHLSHNQHRLIWKGVIEIQIGGEEHSKFTVGGALGLCIPKKKEDYLRKWDAILKEVAWGAKLYAFVIIEEDCQAISILPGNLEAIFDRGDKDILELCLSVASDHISASEYGGLFEGDAVRFVNQVAEPKLKRGFGLGDAGPYRQICFIPLKLKDGRSFFALLQYNPKLHISQLIFPLVLQDCAVVLNSLCKKYMIFDKEVRGSLGYERDSYLVGQFSSIFCMETVSFIIYSKSSLSLSKFLKSSEPTKPTHRMWLMPCSFPYYDVSTWSSSTRIVSISLLDPIPHHKEFHGTLSYWYDSMFLVMPFDHGWQLERFTKEMVFLIMRGKGKELIGYFPNAEERMKILKYLVQMIPVAENCKLRHMKFHEAKANSQWNQFNKLNIQSDVDKVYASPIPVGRPVKLTYPKVDMERTNQLIEELKLEVVNDCLSSPDYLRPRVCSFCRTEAYDMKVCSTCHVTFYCSTVCQKKDRGSHSRSKCLKILETRFREHVNQFKVPISTKK